MPLVTQWADCSGRAVCEVNQMSVVRFGAGVSFKYQLLDVDDATGLGNITCSTSEFGLGSPGRRAVSPPSSAFRLASRAPTLRLRTKSSCTSNLAQARDGLPALCRVHRRGWPNGPAQLAHGSFAVSG